jgi:cardiolipin synthase
MNWRDGHALQLLECGREYFPALIAAIDGARHEVRLETYIFSGDEVGQQVMSALIRAARRGVPTYLLIDGIGSRGLQRAAIEELRRGRVHVLIYRPDLSPFRITMSRLRRLHRKVVVIDGETAFVGGINIVSDYAPPNRDHPQFDYALRVQGPVLADIQRSTRHLWQITAWATFRRRGPEPPPLPDSGAAGSARVAFVFRDNFRHRREIERMYLDAINGARCEIVLANAYFLPGRRMQRALLQAARRGVRVMLLLQGATDHPWLRLATQWLYERLLKGGIQVAEYHLAMLHAKVCVVDQRWCTVGSSNLDPFSLLLAREANLVADDARLAQQLVSSLRDAIAHGAVVQSASAWRARSVLARVGSWLAYHTARAVMGIAGLRG